ncbi:hypothetical protein ABZ478_20130 [Streptomyces sp. NPDC005706]|uniref:hypothetical protein n=1 Tax=Streptomyces sp. NPDC005706 TaxID=3157169 RepID=UPI0033CE9EBB
MFWLHLAPSMFALALEAGLGFLSLTQAAVYRVDLDKAGSPWLSPHARKTLAWKPARPWSPDAQGPDRRRRNGHRRSSARPRHPQRPTGRRAGLAQALYTNVEAAH